MSGVITNKKKAEHKFVSVFADSTPDVDVTFREKLLNRPSDHFQVGVDNLTVSLNSLSMLDYETGYVLRIGHITKPAQAASFSHYDHTVSDQANIDLDAYSRRVDVNAANTAFPVDAGQEITSNSDLPLFNVQQFVQRLSQLAEYFNTRIMGPGAALALDHVAQTGYYVGFSDVGVDDQPANGHLSFELRPDGKLEVVGSRCFWANFFISFEKPKYQRIFDGKRQAQDTPMFIGVLPHSGVRYGVGVQGTRADGVKHICFYNQGYRVVAGGAVTYTTLTNQHEGWLRGNTEMDLVVNTRVYRNTKHRLVLGGNIWSTLDRRIAVEVGSSLPTVNSPMIDHNQESPDFVLGRWIYNTRGTQTMGLNGKNGESMIMCPSVVEYQNSTDRVQYHSLMPQERIQTIRLKLFIRVRSYDKTNDTFGMKTIVPETAKTDWWHARLHFISKD